MILLDQAFAESWGWSQSSAQLAGTVAPPLRALTAGGSAGVYALRAPDILGLIPLALSVRPAGAFVLPGVSSHGGRRHVPSTTRSSASVGPPCSPVSFSRLPPPGGTRSRQAKKPPPARSPAIPTWTAVLPSAAIALAGRVLHPRPSGAMSEADARPVTQTTYVNELLVILSRQPWPLVNDRIPGAGWY